MSEERTAAVLAMPFPRSNKELHRYLGLVNDERRHIENFAIITKPLPCEVNELVAV